MARLLTLVAFVGVTHILGLLLDPETGPGGGTFFLGFLLLSSYLAGRAAKGIHLPQITGYLIIGILVGPHILGVLPEVILQDFHFVNKVALALIALSAGGELRLESLRDRFRSIGVITTAQIVSMFSMVAASVYLARGAIGFLEGEPDRVALAVALLFGLVAVAKSPATTIAVITEERARGILTDTVLGITVVKDVVILVLIAVLIPLAGAIADPAVAFSSSEAGGILLEILGSLALGTALGWLVTFYLGAFRAYRILFVLGIGFLAVYLGERLHLEYILIALAAGFWVQNFSRQGRRLLRALEVNSMPVYALFFAFAGANLNISLLREAWVLAMAIILTRVVALWLSTYLAAGLVGDPPVIRRYAWMGFLAKAGVTLGIANRIMETFPGWGADVATVIIAMIAVNQLVGPPLFRWSIVRAGESRTHPPRKVRKAASSSPLVQPL
jgi:Kef-type K+ transport system membrane component KefB